MRAASPCTRVISSTTIRASASMRPGNRTRPVARAFGSWKKKTDVEEDEDDDDEAKINFKGLKQLISMGLGTMSGDITEINLLTFGAALDENRDDPTRTVVMELEANNFEDADGKPLNFMNNDGFVGEKGEKTSPLNYVVPIVLGGVSVAGVVATLKALS